MIAYTTEDTQNIANYHGLCVTVMRVEITMIKSIWRTISQRDQGNETTAALVGIGTVHAEDIYNIQSIQVCTGPHVMKMIA